MMGYFVGVQGFNGKQSVGFRVFFLMGNGFRGKLFNGNGKWAQANGRFEALIGKISGFLPYFLMGSGF